MPMVTISVLLGNRKLVFTSVSGALGGQIKEGLPYLLKKPFGFMSASSRLYPCFRVYRVLRSDRQICFWIPGPIFAAPALVRGYRSRFGWPEESFINPHYSLAPL
jgi:hypothetical protein